MTLKDLKEKIDLYMTSERNHELNVCISNNKRGVMGGTPVTNVKGCNNGIDWNKGQFFLWPEKDMMEIPD